MRTHSKRLYVCVKQMHTLSEYYILLYVIDRFMALQIGVWTVAFPNPRDYW